MSVWQATVNSTTLMALTEELWKIWLWKLKIQLFTAFLWGVTCPPTVQQRGTRVCTPAPPVQSPTWAQPVGLQLRFWWMKLCTGMFLFAASAAVVVQHFASLGFMALILDDFGPNEILANSQLSVLFWLVTQNTGSLLPRVVVILFPFYGGPVHAFG